MEATSRPLTYTANQPLFLGGQIYMWNRYAQCRVLVHMTQAQYTTKGHQSRNQLRGPSGEPFWAIVPLNKAVKFQRLADTYPLDLPRAIATLRKTLKSAYGRAPYFQSVMDHLIDPWMEWALEKPRSLSELNVKLTKDLAGRLLPDLHHVLDTHLLLCRPESPSEWVAEMGLSLGCTNYIGGGTAYHAYVKQEDFDTRGITYTIQDWKMPLYYRGRSRSDGLTTWASDGNLSILDPLFYAGLSFTKDMICDSPR